MSAVNGMQRPQEVGSFHSPLFRSVGMEDISLGHPFWDLAISKYKHLFSLVWVFCSVLFCCFVVFCPFAGCAVLCCAVLCGAVLCCAMLCCAVLCCAVLCCFEFVCSLGELPSNILDAENFCLEVPEFHSFCLGWGRRGRLARPKCSSVFIVGMCHRPYYEETISCIGMSHQ